MFSACQKTLLAFKGCTHCQPTCQYSGNTSWFLPSASTAPCTYPHHSAHHTTLKSSICVSVSPARQDSRGQGTQLTHLLALRQNLAKSPSKLNSSSWLGWLHCCDRVVLTPAPFTSLDNPTNGLGHSPHRPTTVGVNQGHTLGPSHSWLCECGEDADTSRS